jgi:Cu(I)/Ag(I) efflux system membrane fusion protein/cobalt-zinc-cadmium efflux system membrane fusion protein
MKITPGFRAAAYVVLVVVAAGALWAGWKYDVSQRLMNKAFVVLGWSDTGGLEPGTAPNGEPGEPEPRGDVALDARRRQLTGVQTVLVEERSLDRTLRATGIVTPDERRLVDVNVKLAGWIRNLRVDYTGRFVNRGDPLFTLYSPELAATEQEYLLARRSREELGTAATPEAATYADRLVEAAERRLERWEISRDQIAQIVARKDTSGQVTLPSPASGYVVEKVAVEGMHVESGQMLFRVADLSVVWVEASIYEQDLPFVRVGQQASIALDAVPGKEMSGRVVYLPSSLEPESRTAKARFEFSNAGGALKPGMFATATLHIAAQPVLAVPENAVLDSGARQFVFVDAEQGHFEPREIKSGARANGQVQVLSGLKSGERVASSAVFLIDSESQLRGALQAFEGTPQSGNAPEPSAGSVPAVTFHSVPDPPRTGENIFEVTVKTPAGAPMDDLEVSVILFMPAMPAMSMPAMRQQFALLRAASPGTYRGPASISGGGQRQLTVAVTRSGQKVASLQTTVVVR